MLFCFLLDWLWMDASASIMHAARHTLSAVLPLRDHEAGKSLARRGLPRIHPGANIAVVYVRRTNRGKEKSLLLPTGRRGRGFASFSSHDGRTWEGRKKDGREKRSRTSGKKLLKLPGHFLKLEEG